MEGERPRFSTEQISQYLNRFYDSEARENVLRELVSADIIKRALDTPEGRLVLSNTVDLIRDNVMSIVRMCIEGKKKNIDSIERSALQIGVAYDFLTSVATMLNLGEVHEKGIKAG